MGRLEKNRRVTFGFWPGARSTLGQRRGDERLRGNEREKRRIRMGRLVLRSPWQAVASSSRGGPSMGPSSEQPQTPGIAEGNNGHEPDEGGCDPSNRDNRHLADPSHLAPSLLNCPLSGFSRILDDDGPFPTRPHREIPADQRPAASAGGPGSSKTRESPNIGELNIPAPEFSWLMMNDKTGYRSPPKPTFRRWRC
jgi:hypothetical protein